MENLAGKHQFEREANPFGGKISLRRILSMGETVFGMGVGVVPGARTL